MMQSHCTGEVQAGTSTVKLDGNTADLPTYGGRHDEQLWWRGLAVPAPAIWRNVYGVRGNDREARQGLAQPGDAEGALRIVRSGWNSTDPRSLH